MFCHYCSVEAVTRCKFCGQLICETHGGKTDCCLQCNSGFAAGDPRATGISEEPISTQKSQAWWRPQQAEEYLPPACYVCQGIARRSCRSCQSKYCPDHAGASGLCKECSKSANLGIYVFAVMGLLLILFFLCNYLFS